ncbi:hypothetical protein B0H17DRAFT_1036375 [Mycena rosella]|uniref:D-3-phosphoglycerate dehydrogenase n=1 Tax=Mycena rosella TaxID=1033263 RepID=A0AAD7M977_MYCRO|nr:hypothetical protein B0H17DRAFT_1036375 [Mycena rosella]
MSSPIAIPASTSHEVAASSPSSSSLHGLQSPQMKVKALHPVENVDLRLLLLENISQEAVAAFRAQGFHVDHHTKAMSEDELVEILPAYHAIGIRSKTKITARVVKAASKLLVIGCFCIGTNQVDLPAAARAGVPVFNSPFSNSRSVAELVMGELSKGCWEVRGKTLGIVGYGHIGAQLSVLAEAFGIRVIFYDILNIMALGSARQADFVTLHVPELPETINMIAEPQLALMKKGSYLINNSRGKVVDIPALIDALKSKHLAGAAIDVFPSEPGPMLNAWASALRAIPNVILTPHIGGSTEEAQRLIGEEVALALTRYLDYGSTVGAVNFPEVDLRAMTQEQDDHIRVCHVHKNQPGVLKQVNDVLSPYNVEKQFSDSKGEVAYLMADIADVSIEEISKLRELISNTSANILTRFLA